MVFNYKRAAMIRATAQLEEAAAAAQGVVSPRTGLRNPVAVSAHCRMAEYVQNVRTVDRPENSQKAYEPKIREFEHFCELNYVNDIYKYNLDAEKVYHFMFYQAFREKRKRGGTKLQRQAGPMFKQDEYEELTRAFVNSRQALPAYPSPKQPMMDTTFAAYKAVIKNLHTEQRTRGVCNLPWDLVWTLDCTNLQKHVKERMPALKKANYVEKVDGEFAPYAIVERYGDIEKLMWMDSQNSKGRRSVCSNLRHRACTLFLSTGILRSESLHKADVSDFFGLKPPKKENDIHDMYLMIMQIPQGKTTRGRKQWGRATRHRNVELCCIGAIAQYLQYRIDCTGEFEDMSLDEWLDNSKWFDIKFLVDVNGGDNTQEMSSDTYSAHVKRNLQRLNLPTNKLCHLGCNVGSKYLDLMEVDAEEIRRMGQWNCTVYDNSYSSKLPMNAMRNLAGYNTANGLYFNTRTTVMPSHELCEKTPLGRFSFRMLNELMQHDVDGRHQTAYETLRFFCDLSTILLQDAAAMMCLHPDRMDHDLFSLNCFHVPEFEFFREEMRTAIETETNPLDAELEKVLPGVNQRLNAAHSVLLCVQQNVGCLAETVTKGFEKVISATDMWNSRTGEMVGCSLVEAGNLLRQSSPMSPGGNSVDTFQRQFGVAAASTRMDTSTTGGTTVTMLSQSQETSVSSERMQASPTGSPADHSRYKPSMKHTSLMSVWNEWFGREEFKDDYGGINGRNMLHGSKWRKHINATAYSKLSQLIKGINQYAAEQRKPPEDVMEEWNPLFVESKYSVSNFVKAMQALGKFKKLKPRGSIARASQ